MHLKIFGGNVEYRVRSQNECTGDLSVNFVFFREKIMFKSHKIKSNFRVLRKNKVNAYDYRPTVLAAKMCINTNEHSMDIRFL